MLTVTDVFFTSGWMGYVIIVVVVLELNLTNDEPASATYQ